MHRYLHLLIILPVLFLAFVPTAFAASATGKGLIYYTENYIRDYSGTNSQYNLPLPYIPTSNIQAAYYDLSGAYSIVKGDRYWYRTSNTANWNTNTLLSAFATGNYQGAGVPVSNIDTAYFDNSGGFTVIKGDRYWYRPNGSPDWFTDTLASAYGSGPPTRDIDVSYFDNTGGLTVIEADRYWYRPQGATTWFTDTLRNAYYTSANAAAIGIPTANVDAAYFDSSGGYTVIQGNTYWFRASLNADWTRNSLYHLYTTSLEPNINFPAFQAQLIRGVDCSRYLDLTQREINYFQELGLDFVILGFGPAAWYNIETQSNVFNFTKLDEWIGRLQAAGIEPVLQLWGTPIWASNTPAFNANNCASNPYTSFSPYNRKPVNLVDFADFAERVVTRYNGQQIQNPFQSGQFLRVNTVSLWNEPNWVDFWAGTASEFVTLNNLAYDRIKSIRSDVTVWSGNLLGSFGARNYLDQIGSSLKFDVFALHAYPANFNLPPTDSSNAVDFAIGNLNFFLTRLNNFYTSKPPVALTEVGYRSNWEHQYGILDINLNDSQKSQNLSQTLQLINQTNNNPATINRFIAVANNVLYNPWRWWSTGLANYYNPVTNQVDFTHKEAAYSAFQSWQHSLPPRPGDLNTDWYVNLIDINYYLNLIPNIFTYNRVVSNYAP